MIFSGFICSLCLLQTVESATTQCQNNLIPSKPENFCNHAGPKLEKIIEMKTKLEAIEQELKHLCKKEETRKKGWLLVAVQF